MASGATEGFFRCVYEGCISGCDMEIERRPYHRNCGCALHRSGKGSSLVSHCSKKKVSYPIRRSWSEGSLVLHAASGHSSPSSSPSVVGAGKPQLGSWDEREENVLFKI